MRAPSIESSTERRDRPDRKLDEEAEIWTVYDLDDTEKLESIHGKQYPGGEREDEYDRRPMHRVESNYPSSSKGTGGDRLETLLFWQTE